MMEPCDFAFASAFGHGGSKLFWTFMGLLVVKARVLDGWVRADVVLVLLHRWREALWTRAQGLREESKRLDPAGCCFVNRIGDGSTGGSMSLLRPRGALSACACMFSRQSLDSRL